MARTYTFVFNPEPEGGYTVTCPALPGLVTYGETLDEARRMAFDAMDGLIEVMLERGERSPKAMRRKRSRALIAWRTRCSTKTMRSRFLSNLARPSARRYEPTSEPEAIVAYFAAIRQAAILNLQDESGSMNRKQRRRAQQTWTNSR